MDYFWLTLRHKWYILLASRAVGKVSLWQALRHDMSKFSRVEYSGYQRQFFGDTNDPEGFAKAWLHQKNIKSSSLT